MHPLPRSTTTTCGSTLAVACATREHSELQALLDAVERYLGSQEWELLRAEREVVVPGQR